MGCVGLNSRILAETAAQLVTDDKGILAIDESSATCNRRLAALDIAQTAENRRRWRELIVTTPHINQSISGMILYDETIHQATSGGRPFVDVLADAGILIGIKVDIGAKPLAGFPSESVTEGLSMTCGSDWLDTPGSARASPNGAPCSARATARPRRPASKPTPTRWPAMPRFARRSGWFQIGRAHV